MNRMYEIPPWWVALIGLIIFIPFAILFGLIGFTRFIIRPITIDILIIIAAILIGGVIAFLLTNALYL